MEKKNKQGLTVKKEENFSEWYTQILEKSEIADLRYNVKGFVVIRPWGARIIEEMYKLTMKIYGDKLTAIATGITQLEERQNERDQNAS